MQFNCCDEGVVKNPNAGDQEGKKTKSFILSKCTATAKYSVNQKMQRTGIRRAQQEHSTNYMKGSTTNGLAGEDTERHDYTYIMTNTQGLTRHKV